MTTTWKKKYGLKMVNLPDQELAKWKEIIKPIWRQWADKLEKKGMNGKKLMAEVQRVQKKYGEPAYVPYVKP